MITFDKLLRSELVEATEFLHRKFHFISTVDLVIQLGSGQSPDNILDEEWGRASLQEMPSLPKANSLAKHKLEIIWGIAGNFKLLIFAGRYHLYEGFGRVPCILPIWAAAQCGARNFVFANAAIAINPEIAPGDFMIFTDHINQMGISPLSGHQHLLESPYINMIDTYNTTLANTFKEAAQEKKMSIKHGVYLANAGPQSETIAELRMARLFGADAVGMSTVLEATTAHALQAKVLGISMITKSISPKTQNQFSPDVAFDIDTNGNNTLISSLRHWLATFGAKVL